MVTLPYLGWVYFIPVLLVSLDLIWRFDQVDPRLLLPRNARGLFMSSNFYSTYTAYCHMCGSVISILRRINVPGLLIS